jgi:Spy/CpxP family protein refolding chaperone
MTPKPLSTLLSVLLLSASGAMLQAQQPTAPPPPPADGSAAPITRATPRGQRGPEQQRMMEHRGGHPEGMSPGGHIAPPGMWWKNPRVIQTLTITDDQQKKMDDIFQKSRLQLIDLKANVEKQDVILEPMLDANPPDTNKVLAQIDHVAQARAELEKANARMLLGIRGVLTADQWTKLQNERNSHRGPKGPGGPGGMGGPEGHRELRFTTPDAPVDAPVPPTEQ